MDEKTFLKFTVGMDIPRRIIISVNYLSVFVLLVEGGKLGYAINCKSKLWQTRRSDLGWRERQAIFRLAEGLCSMD